MGGHFNPRGPYRPRRYAATASDGRKDISIHEAHTGLDRCVSLKAFGANISIHEAHTGLDCFIPVISFGILNFNPRGPYRPRLNAGNTCGMGTYFNPRGPYRPRLHPCWWIDENGKFQSTRPIQASTTGRETIKPAERISIHEAHTGLDV